MTRLFAAALVAALIVPVASADAGSRHSKHYRHHARMMWRAPVALPQRYGPPWAGPNQCWEDLGYGRYESCDQ